MKDMIAKVKVMMRFKVKLLWFAGCGVGVWFFFTVIYVNNLSKHGHKGEMHMRTKYRIQNLRGQVSERWGSNIYKDMQTASLTYNAAPHLGNDYIDDTDVAKYLINEQKKKLNRYAINVNNFIEHKWQGSSKVHKTIEIVGNDQGKNKEVLPPISQKDSYVDGLRNKLKADENALDRRDISAQIDDKIRQIKEKEKLQNEVLQDEDRNGQVQMIQPGYPGNRGQGQGQLRVEIQNQQLELDVDSIVDVNDKREHRQFARGLIKANLGLDRETLQKVYRQAIKEGHAALPSNTKFGPKLKQSAPREKVEDTNLRFQPQREQQADQQYIQLMNGNKNPRKHPTIYRQVVHVNQAARDQHRMNQNAQQPQKMNQNAQGWNQNNKVMQNNQVVHSNQVLQNNQNVQPQQNVNQNGFVRNNFNWNNAQQYSGTNRNKNQGQQAQLGNVPQNKNSGSFKQSYNNGKQYGRDLVKSGGAFAFKKANAPPDFNKQGAAFNSQPGRVGYQVNNVGKAGARPSPNLGQMGQNAESQKFAPSVNQGRSFKLPPGDQNVGQNVNNQRAGFSNNRQNIAVGINQNMNHNQNFVKNINTEMKVAENPPLVNNQNNFIQNNRISVGNNGGQFDTAHVHQRNGFNSQGLSQGRGLIFNNNNNINGVSSNLQKNTMNMEFGNVAKNNDKNPISSKVSVVVNDQKKSIMDLKQMDTDIKKYNNMGGNVQSNVQQGVMMENKPAQNRRQGLPSDVNANGVHNNHFSNKNSETLRFSNNAMNSKDTFQLNDGAKQALRLNRNQPGGNQQFIMDKNSGGRGKNLPRALTEDEYLDVKDSYNRHSFNVVASENVPLRRSVPDTRPKGCPGHYDVYNMPKASIVICFHNEAWSTLLRTVHSVLDTTPSQLLQEIILVDDFSTRDYLGGKLEAYVAELPKVFLLRTTQREGLARARMRGVSLAKGEILVFLDSHCECNAHWIEPLVEAIQIDRMKVVSPQMDIIDHTTFAYKPAPTNLYGSFGWDLQFAWKPMPLHERNRRSKPIDGIRTPAMAGGLFAIDKYYFYHLGGFDSGMEIWGSENIELSLRIWMCGGSIEILPCSRVGHVFRPTIPYGFPGGPTKTLHDNANRVAEIWLDEYKGIYYATQSSSYDPTSLSSIQERINQKRKLKCKTFNWYISNVLPELIVPATSAEYFGLIHNGHSGWCLSYVNAQQAASVLANTCDEYNRYQTFTLSVNMELIFDHHCLTYFPHDNSLQFRTCDSNYGSFQKWIYQTNKIQLAYTNQPGAQLCLDLNHKVANQVIMARCLPSSTSQIWHFTYHFNPQRMQQMQRYIKT